MRVTKLLAVLSLFGFMVGCTTIYGVDYDYNKQTDFAKLKRFDWMQVPDRAELDSFVVERVQSAVNSGLEAKGLTKTSDTPDFSIVMHVGKKDKVQVTDLGYAYGAYGGYWGGFYGPGGGVSSYQYEEGTLILDFVDAQSKELIWRGSAKAEIQDLNTPEKREKVIDEAVNNILEKFPPPPSK
jgi:hypothetical protein